VKGDWDGRREDLELDCITTDVQEVSLGVETASSLAAAAKVDAPLDINCEASHANPLRGKWGFCFDGRG
jgi:hypothetical protein